MPNRMHTNMSLPERNITYILGMAFATQQLCSSCTSPSISTVTGNQEHRFILLIEMSPNTAIGLGSQDPSHCTMETWLM